MAASARTSTCTVTPSARPWMTAPTQAESVGGRLLPHDRDPVATASPGMLVDVPAPRLEITYCTQCRWLLRAGWTAQELLTTFPGDLGEVALVPGTGGVFRVRLDEELLWDREEQGGFPELSRLKQLVRDRVAPDRSLGHSDAR